MNTYIENHPFLVEDQNSGFLYYLTCASKVSGTRSAIVTQYPTVSGKSISDNMYVQPLTCTFNVKISSIYSTPQKYLDPNTQRIVQLTAEDLKQQIKDWQTNAIRLNITTFEDYFSNMVLDNIQSDEDGDTEIGVWSASLKFTEVRVAHITEVKLDFPATPEEEANSNDEMDLGPDNGSTAAEVGEALGYAAGGALVGAAIGSAIVPGVGTIIGAIGGTVLAWFMYLLND